ncbi:MAG: helix-turn-helix domain-containing protein [Coprococcus sp.]
MDANRLGSFIAERRKELGLTQVVLAEKLHVTDKAVSRWERGVGLPDINSIEALADALEVSLIELMQAQRIEKDNISTKEAEKLLVDTIQLSKTTSRIVKCSGSIIIWGFISISVVLLLLLISDGKIILFSVGSLIAGLISWGLPIYQISLARTPRIVTSVLSSFGFALISLAIQFLNIAYKIHMNDWAAVEDTIDVLVIIVFIFILGTLGLNFMMIKFSKYKRG